MSAPTPEPAPLDLDELERHWLPMCPTHEIGEPGYGCNCPQGDPRQTIADLITELREARTEVARLAREATAADGRWLAVWSITGPVERVAEQASIALAQMASEYADAGPVKLRAELRADGGEPR